MGLPPHTEESGHLGHQMVPEGHKDGLCSPDSFSSNTRDGSSAGSSSSCGPFFLLFCPPNKHVSPSTEFLNETLTALKPGEMMRKLP